MPCMNAQLIMHKPSLARGFTKPTYIEVARFLGQWNLPMQVWAGI